MAEQQGDFRLALAQRRHVDGKNVEAVVEVLAEAPLLHGFVDVHVGGGQDAHVHIHHMAAAQPRILVILQNVQELGLQVRAHLRDFVEEDGAFVGHFEFAGLGAHRAGKRALLITEQFRFQELARKRRAIHFDEGLVAPLGAQMNHARHDFLAHSALSTDKNRHVYRSDLQDLLADAHHLRAGRQEAEVLGDLLAVVAQRLVLGVQLFFLAALQHGRIQLAFFEGLGQIVQGANADCFHDGAHFVRAGEHDDVQGTVQLHQILERLQAVHLRHEHVEDDEVRTLAPVHLRQDFPAGGHGLDFKTVHFEQRLQVFADARLVIHDHDFLAYRHKMSPLVKPY